MRALLALLVVVVSTTQVACRKAETKEPGAATTAEATAPAQATAPGEADPVEAAALATLNLIQDCYAGGPPVGVMVHINTNKAGELESVTIEPPADEPTTACVLAKVKGSDLKTMTQ